MFKVIELIGGGFGFEFYAFDLRVWICKYVVGELGLVLGAGVGSVVFIGCTGFSEFGWSWFWVLFVYGYCYRRGGAGYYGVRVSDIFINVDF